MLQQATSGSTGDKAPRPGQSKLSAGATIARRIQIGRTSVRRILGTKSCWYSYLDGKVNFPFQARCVATKVVSPLRKGETIEVLRMAAEDACEHDMLVQIRWQARKIAIPLDPGRVSHPERRAALPAIFVSPDLETRSYPSASQERRQWQ